MVEMTIKAVKCFQLTTYTNLPLCHTQTGNTDIICVTLSIWALCDDVKGGEMARRGHSGEFMHPEMSLHRGATEETLSHDWTTAMTISLNCGTVT